MSDEIHNRVGVVVRCATCGLMKKPIGRSGPLQATYCEPNHFAEQDGCDGYDQEPRVGTLWPGETCADFGYAHSHDGTVVAVE